MPHSLPWPKCLCRDCACKSAPLLILLASYLADTYFSA